MGANNFANLLFSQPTFASGAGRVLDIGGKYDRYNYSPSGEEADRIAMAADWYAIGDDMRRAFETFDPSEPDSDNVL